MKIGRIIDCFNEVKRFFPEFSEFSFADVNDYTIALEAIGLDGEQYKFTVEWSNRYGGWITDFDIRYPDYNI